VTHRQDDPKGCDCWFYLYNGYCSGHRDDSRSYFNSDPYSSNDRLTEWTKSPLIATEQYRESNKEISTDCRSTMSLDYRSGKRYDIIEYSTGEEDLDENVLYDG
jgi:hypothetical protein